MCRIGQERKLENNCQSLRLKRFLKEEEKGSKADRVEDPTAEGVTALMEEQIINSTTSRTARSAAEITLGLATNPTKDSMDLKESDFVTIVIVK